MEMIKAGIAGINKPIKKTLPEQKEEAALYGKNLNDAITAINGLSMKRHFRFKAIVAVALFIILVADMIYLHLYFGDIFSKIFLQGSINHENSPLLETIFFSNILAIVGLTTGIVTLAVKQPFLPLENRDEKKIDKIKN